MVWPSILRFMQRYAVIANFNPEQMMIAQMFCDFILLDVFLLKKKPSLLGAVAIYATNRIANRQIVWNQSLVTCTGGITEEEIVPLYTRLFCFIKRLQRSTLQTMFRKYERPNYMNVIRVIQRI